MLQDPIEDLAPESLQELASLCFQLELFSAAVTLYGLIRERGEPGELALYRLGIASLKLGRDQQAEKCFRDCVALRPEVGATWLQLGHLYKVRGDATGAAEHYRRYIELSPMRCGSGYWSLADLKGYRFSDGECKAMESALEKLQGAADQATALNFALGRAAEQSGNPAQALNYYHRGNQLHDQLAPFRKEHFCHLVEELQRAECRKINADQGSAGSAPSPIFIVGMPRSGSTLIEQILSSHSQVQATDELPFMERMALELEMSGGYASALNSLSVEQIDKMRSAYLLSAAAYLPAHCSYFIDKNPGNFLHVGLIKTLFPQALIIDSRRDPRDNAISVFRQNFSVGNEFASSFENIALYYEKYQQLMRHWQQQHGATLCIQSYEKLANNPDEEIASLLEFCGLNSEPACFEFYNTRRNIMTPSVSQVTQPMYTSAIGQWQAFETLLADEMAALGLLAAKNSVDIRQ